MKTSVEESAGMDSSMQLCHSSWNDMNSVIQVAAEMIYVLEVGTEVKSTVE